jgi:outer membrane protein OmpA-like peptidoglycan-associated protein
VDNINARKNANLYIDNADWDPNNILKWADDRGRGELALTYQYDGFTTLMSAGSAVIPLDRYRISFAICDIGDDLFDSAVFLEQGSFSTKNRKRTKRQEYIIGKLKNELIDQSVEIIEADSAIKLRLYIQFDFDDDQIKSEKDKKLLDQIARMLRMQNSIQVGIEGHTDNVGSYDYNDDLSGRRAFSVAQYLMDSGLDVDRMSARGFGATRPISENATKEGRDKNRRVDLVLK